MHLLDLLHLLVRLDLLHRRLIRQSLPKSMPYPSLSDHIRILRLLCFSGRKSLVAGHRLNASNLAKETGFNRAHHALRDAGSDAACLSHQHLRIT